MLQAVMVKAGKINFNEIDIPSDKANEVIINIKKIGICGSDIHVYHGKHPYTSYPVVQGHEVSGIVYKVGDNVSDFKVGDKVTVRPQVVCGECYSCRNGNYHICDNLKVMGFQTTGCASEFVAVNKNNVICIPEDISLDSGAMIEPLAVAVHAVKKGGDVKDKKVLVLGAGPIGNLVAQVAKALGAKEVMITDLSDYRLNLSKECNIDYCVNTKNINLNDALKESFGQDKADIIFECVGSKYTMNDAIDNARKGTNIVVVGVFGEKCEIDLGLVQDRELNLIGTLMYKEEDYSESIRLLKNNDILLEPLITKHFKFSDYDNAYKYIEAQRDKCMKVMINL